MCFSASASFTAAGFLIIWGVANGCLLVCRSHRSTMNVAQRASLGLVAAIPFLFGAHQLSEGFVWQDSTNRQAIRCFAYTAYVFWPLFISISFGLVEWTRRRRRRRNGRRRGQQEQEQPPPVPPTLSPTRTQARRTSIFWTYWPGATAAASPNDDNRGGGWPVRRRQQILAVHVVLALAMTSLVLRDMITNDPNTVLVHRGRLHYEGWALDYHAHTVALALVYVYVVVGTLVVSSLRYTTMFGGMILLSLVIAIALYQNQYPSTWCFFAAILSCFITLIVWYELDWYDHPDDDNDNDNNNDNDSCGEVEEPPLTELQQSSARSLSTEKSAINLHSCYD